MHTDRSHVDDENARRVCADHYVDNGDGTRTHTTTAGGGAPIVVSVYPTHTVRHRPAANPAHATRRAISGPDGFAAKRVPFQGNSIKAVEGAYWGTGRLRNASEAAYDAYYAARAADTIVYTVVSYSTPIAWVLSDGTVVIPAVKYSPTTSNHQGLLAWLDPTHGERTQRPA